MKRREFLGALLATLPLARGFAQANDRVFRIGSLHAGPLNAPHHVAFYEELARAGFVLGKNLKGDPSGYGLSGEQYAAHAVDLVNAKVDAIVCGGDLAIRALQQLTTKIPILAVTDDMLSSGLVKSLSRPEGNTTGVSIFAAELDAKRQEILLEMFPSLTRIALLADTNSVLADHIARLGAHAAKAGVAMTVHRAGKVEDIPAAIAEAKSGGDNVALNVLATPLFFNSRSLIFAKVAEAGLPAIYQWPEMAETGGLAAYGPRIVDIYQSQLSRQLAKVLQGVAIAEIPVEQPTKFYLVINRKTAAALSLAVPPTLLARADTVIE